MLKACFGRQPCLPDEAHVNRVVRQCLKLVGDRQIEHIGRHVRPHLAKGSQRQRQDLVVHVHDVANVQRAIFAQAQATQVVHVACRLREQPARALQEKRPASVSESLLLSR